MMVVPYAPGAAGPVEIAAAAKPYGGVLFVTETADPELDPVVTVLSELGSVVSTAAGMAGVEAALAGRPASGVVTFADTMLPVAAVVAEHFDLPGPTGGTWRLLTDKAAQRRRLNDAGLPRVATASFVPGTGPTSLPDVGFPAVIKPVTGAGSEHTVIVRSADELPGVLSRLPAGRAFVAEEFIEGAPYAEQDWLADYLSVESAVAGGRVRHLGLTGRLPLTPPAREAGVLFPVRPPGNLAAAIEQTAERAIRALGIEVGLVHTEVKMSPDGPRVIEVNGRLGGKIGQLMRDVGCADPVPLALALAAGEPLPPPELPPGEQALLFLLHPPVDARSVLRLPPVPQVRRLPGVLRAQQLARAGAVTDWRAGLAAVVYEVWLRDADIDRLRDNLAGVRDFLAETVEWEWV